MSMPTPRAEQEPAGIDPTCGTSVCAQGGGSVLVVEYGRPVITVNCVTRRHSLTERLIGDCRYEVAGVPGLCGSVSGR